MLGEIEIDPGASEASVLSSPSVTTALLPLIGYGKAAEMAALMKKEKIDIFEANERLGYVEREKLKELLRPENMMQGGYRLKDFI